MSADIKSFASNPGFYPDVTVETNATPQSVIFKPVKRHPIFNSDIYNRLYYSKKHLNNEDGALEHYRDMKDMNDNVKQVPALPVE